MKSLLVALVAVAVAGAGAIGCGSGHRRTGASTAATAPASTVAAPAASTTATSASSMTHYLANLKQDEDGDYDSPVGSHRYDKDDDQIRKYGHAADAAEARAVTAVVKGYLAAGAASNGAAACPLLFSLLAESIPEDYGQPPGPPALRGKTCAVVMSKLFGEHHAELALHDAKLKVTGVRVSGKRGWALLGVGEGSDHMLLLHREGKAWKVDQLLDEVLP